MLFETTLCVCCVLRTDPPVIRREPDAGLVIKGRSTELSCEADGNPAITYEWFKVCRSNGCSLSDLAVVVNAKCLANCCNVN